MIASQKFRVSVYCATVVLSAGLLDCRRVRAQGTAASPDLSTAELAEQLADAHPGVRLRANELLKTKGIEVFDVLHEHRNSPSLEQQMAAHRLKQQLKIDWNEHALPEPLSQILIDYQHQSPLRRKILLERIEEGEQPDSFYVLARLARFEVCPHLSRQAAICLLRSGIDTEHQTQAVLQIIGNSQRPACTWIRDAVESPTRTSDEFVSYWISHLQTEFFDRPPTSDSLQTKLMCQLVAWLLQELAERDEWAAVNFIAFQSALNCPRESIANFTDHFIQLECWPALDELVDRFPDEFNNQPLIAYRLAYANLLRGNPEMARRWSQRASKLALNPQAELETAVALQRLGYQFIAEQILKSLSLRADCPLLTHTRAQLILAEWFHQNDRNAEARNQMELIQTALESNTTLEKAVFDQIGSSHQQVSARRCLFTALDCLDHGDRLGCECSILGGIQIDPAQTDLLILAFQCHFISLETKSLVLQLVTLRQQELLREISELKTYKLSQLETTGRRTRYQLELASLYNQFAWLTANTTGNLKKALTFARMSNELTARNPYYLDTEAKCWFVVGDLAKAVTLQTEACRLAIHDLAMQKQLASFKRFQNMTPIARLPLQSR